MKYYIPQASNELDVADQTFISFFIYQTATA